MNTRHKTHSSQKLATLLLSIDTAICRVGDMHSESPHVMGGSPGKLSEELVT